MGNRCESCQKFVSLDAAEPEEESTELEGDEITSSVRVHLDCAECGSEMKEYTFELSESLPDDVIDHRAEHDEAKDGKDINVVYDSAEVGDFYRPRVPPKPRKDGTIPRVPMRFQTHFYSLSATFNVNCDCGKEFDNIEITDEIAASSFEEL